MLLRVYLLDRYVGELETVSGTGMRFAYDDDYLNAAGALPLSISLPLRSEPYNQAELLPFFEGLLPEGDERERVARYLRVSAQSPMRLLAALAGDCAGAVSVRDTLEEDAARACPQTEASYEPIAIETMRELLRPNSATRVPFETDNRLSLAGGQGKLSLHRTSEPEGLDGWLLPVGGAPTTYIVKPGSPYFAGLAVNEFLCLRWAEACGLAVERSWLICPEEPALVVERFDRMRVAGRYVRLLQEDCCQALGVTSGMKYEGDGGPGVAAIARLLYEWSAAAAADVEDFVRLLLFNLFIGNCDAHGKNYSLVLAGNGMKASTQDRYYRLTPAYDLASTTFYPELTSKLAMRYGGEARIDAVRGEHLDRLARDCGVGARFVRSLAAELAERMRGTLDGVCVDAADAGFDVAALQAHLTSELAKRSGQIGL